MPQIVRQNGQLVETQLDSQQLAKLQGQPVGPNTPAGAADLGANPDQAKMSGSAAQQQAAQPVLEDQQKPADTLQTAQRTSSARTQATDVETKAQAKAAQLQQLGSLNTRVQDLIQKELELKSPAQAELAQAEVGALPAEKKAALEAVLKEVLASPQDPNVLARATQAWVDAGLGTVQSFSPEKFVAGAQDVLGKNAAGQVRDTVQLSGLPLSEPEAKSLTEVFGDRWQSFTVPQLQQEIETLRQAEFSRTQALKAELANAAPGSNQAELLTRELADVGQVGAQGVEQQVKGLKDQVDRADVVKIGEEDFKVADLLKDEKISSLVTQMLNDGALKEKIRKTQPAFVEWVEKNAKDLATLADDVKKSQGKVRDVWEQKHALAKIGGGELSDKVMRTLIPNWDKVEASVPNVDNIGLVQKLKEIQAADPKAALAMVDGLNEAGNDPDLMKKLAKLSPAEVQAAWDRAKDLDSDPLVAELAGLKDSPFVVDDSQQALIAKMKGVADTIKSSRLPEDVWMDDSFKKLLKSGDFGVDQIKQLAAQPDPMGFYTKYKSYLGKYDEIRQASASGDIDKMLDVAFGRDVNVDALNQEYALLRQYENVDPAMRAKVQEIQASLDLHRDGVIDEKDVGLMKDKLLAGMGDPQSLAGLLGKGGDPFRDLGAPLKNSKIGDGTAALEVNQSKSMFDKLSRALLDGKLTDEEIALIGKEPGGLDKVFSGNYAEALQGKTRQTYDTAMAKKQEAYAYNASTQGIDKLARDYFGSTGAVTTIGNRFSDPYYVFPSQDEAWVQRAIQELQSQRNQATYDRAKVPYTDMINKLSAILADNERNKKNLAARQAKEAAAAEAEKQKKVQASVANINLGRGAPAAPTKKTTPTYRAGR